MFQEPRLLPWSSIQGNVEVGLARGTPPALRQARALSALAEVGLQARVAEWPSVLSGGQKQRVALARALVSRPRLLALDEPLGALDALTRIEMQALVEEVWRLEGFTAVLVTHDVGEAVALADRVILLEQGRVAMDVGIDLPRPRRRGDAALAALEARILDRLLGEGR
jgi:sulfonate transport system ATP-binding protein